MSTNVPSECPTCGISLDASKINQQTVNGSITMYCEECGDRLPLGKQTRVNYKSPVVDDDES